MQTIKTCSYGCPHKYRGAWQILIQQHLDAEQIRPSNSVHALPADSHPLPRVEDILADCAKGKIWSKLDMTNSFFQTHIHPDDVHLMAVTTPFSLYEWLAMPMGLRNSPPIIKGEWHLLCVS